MNGCNVQDPCFWDKRKHSGNYRGAPLHAHDVHELYFLLSGTTKYFLCDEFFVLQPGEMVFIPKNQLHQTEYNNNAGIERVLFSFDDDFVDPSLHGCLREMAANKHITFTQHGLLKITDLVEKIEKERQKGKPLCEEMQRVYFQQLLIQISRYRTPTETEAFPAPLMLIQRILEHINSNYTADITLASLSDTFSISPSHLSKSFKYVTGLGVKEYLNVSRVSAAKTLLETTNLSITQIATKCGYNDSNYFAAVFKRIVGVTPKKYALLNRQK